MKTIATLLVAILLGFFLKVGVAEAERSLSVNIVDECFEQYESPTQDQEAACYTAPQQSFVYRLVAALNFQPHLWKNNNERCANPNEKRNEDYFQCHWWNQYAL